jgi:hypothetical protein
MPYVQQTGKEDAVLFMVVQEKWWGLHTYACMNPTGMVTVVTVAWRKLYLM